jgi:hypothetical protein
MLPFTRIGDNPHLNVSSCLGASWARLSLLDRGSCRLVKPAWLREVGQLHRQRYAGPTT